MTDIPNGRPPTAGRHSAKRWHDDGRPPEPFAPWWILAASALCVGAGVALAFGGWTDTWLLMVGVCAAVAAYWIEGLWV